MRALVAFFTERLILVACNSLLYSLSQSVLTLSVAHAIVPWPTMKHEYVASQDSPSTPVVGRGSDGGKGMQTHPGDLTQLRQTDPAVALIMDTFENIDRVYRQSLKAMGMAQASVPEVRNSADVSVSLRPVDITNRPLT